eukprot:SAG22_NODE_15798_length_340_cov_0.850622_2_plen_51_part_01
MLLPRLVYNSRIRVLHVLVSKSAYTIICEVEQQIMGGTIVGMVERWVGSEA